MHRKQFALTLVLFVSLSVVGLHARSSLRPVRLEGIVSSDGTICRVGESVEFLPTGPLSNALHACKGLKIIAKGEGEPLFRRARVLSSSIKILRPEPCPSVTITLSAPPW